MRCPSGHGATRCSASTPPARSSNTHETSFDGFSYARADPRNGADGDVFWVTAEGGLKRWSYTYPDSGDFRVRAVFKSSDGERRSAYLTRDQLTEFPEATPAP